MFKLCCYENVLEVFVILSFFCSFAVYNTKKMKLCNEPNLPQILVSDSNMEADGVNQCKIWQ